MKRRAYTEEFKKQALDLAKSLGSTTAAAKQLGIGDSVIYAWKDRLEKTSPSLVAAEAEELKRLRKEVSDLKKVNYILKAAAAFFSQDHLK
jgi:transposase